MFSVPILTRMIAETHSFVNFFSLLCKNTFRLIQINSFQTVARFPDVTFIWKYESPEDAFAKVTEFFTRRSSEGERRGSNAKV